MASFFNTSRRLMMITPVSRRLDFGESGSGGEGYGTSTVSRKPMPRDVLEPVLESDESTQTSPEPLMVDESTQTFPSPDPVPETPPPSPTDVSVADGVVSNMILKLVRVAFRHLLRLTITKFQKENCYGCQVDHPSQRQHQCLEIPEKDFFNTHAPVLTVRLFNPNFIPAIPHFLSMHHIDVEGPAISKMVETLFARAPRLEDEDEGRWTRFVRMTTRWTGWKSHTWLKLCL